MYIHSIFQITGYMNMKTTISVTIDAETKEDIMEIIAPRNEKLSIVINELLKQMIEESKNGKSV